MRIHIGSDHAGLDFKNELITHLVMNGHDVTDHGPYEYDALDDYPDFCSPCAEAVAKNPESLGIVLGGSGNGEQMAANKVKGVRAALVWSIETAKLAREQVQCLCIGMLDDQAHDHLTAVPRAAVLQVDSLDSQCLDVGAAEARQLA